MGAIDQGSFGQNLEGITFKGELGVVVRACNPSSRRTVGPESSMVRPCLKTTRK